MSVINSTNVGYLAGYEARIIEFINTRDIEKYGGDYMRGVTPTMLQACFDKFENKYPRMPNVDREMIRYV